MLTEIVSYVKNIWGDPYPNQDPYFKDTLKHLQKVEKELRTMKWSGWNLWFFNRGYAKIQKSNEEFFMKYPLTEEDKNLIATEKDIFSFVEKKGKSKSVYCLEDVLVKERDGLRESLQNIDAYEILTKMYRQCSILNTSPKEAINIFFENDTMGDITHFTSSDFKEITHLMYKDGFINDTYRDRIIHQFLDDGCKKKVNHKEDTNKIVYLFPENKVN